MTFVTAVERWRQTVRDALKALTDQDDARKSLISSLGLTISPGLEDIILSIVATESGGNPNAVGDDNNSVGLMQLDYGLGTPQSVGYSGSFEGLKDPYTNVFTGAKYFLVQLARYQDVNKAILAYNDGSYRVTSAGVPVNIEYLNKVLSFLSEKKTSSSQASPSMSPTNSSPTQPAPVVQHQDPVRSLLSVHITPKLFYIIVVLGLIGALIWILRGGCQTLPDPLATDVLFVTKPPSSSIPGNPILRVAIDSIASVQGIIEGIRGSFRSDTDYQPGHLRVFYAVLLYNPSYTDTFHLNIWKRDSTGQIVLDSSGHRIGDTTLFHCYPGDGCEAIDIFESELADMSGHRISLSVKNAFSFDQIIQLDTGVVPSRGPYDLQVGPRNGDYYDNSTPEQSFDMTQVRPGRYRSCWTLDRQNRYELYQRYCFDVWWDGHTLTAVHK